MLEPDSSRCPRIGLLSATLVAAVLSACSNHYLIHPKQVPPSLTVWSEDVDRGNLRIRLEWARPAGDGPFPAVMVHPEAGHVAREMRGILHSLALEGYLAVAADYRRIRSDGPAAGKLFVWRDREDVEALLAIVGQRQEVDPDRIGAIGFSQGGVYSLLIAANTGGVSAVVAYYPVTDFEYWLNDPDRGWGRRQVFKLIRRYFRKRSGARSDEEFSELLARASALPQAESIRAPVLLIHGDGDTSAGIGESRRLERRLRELGREVELLEIEGAGHVFNFFDAARAEQAWKATLAWLHRHLRHDGEPGRLATPSRR